MKVSSTFRLCIVPFFARVEVVHCSISRSQIKLHDLNSLISINRIRFQHRDSEVGQTKFEQLYPSTNFQLPLQNKELDSTIDSI